MSAEQGDMSHLDQFYLGGPVTPMSRAEEDEYAAWRADYHRRTTPVAEQGDVEAWEDMRAYNIRLEERAREAELALAEMREALREIDEMESNAGTYDVVWDGVRQWVPKFKVIARAALRPFEDTSDES